MPTECIKHVKKYAKRLGPLIRNILPNKKMNFVSWREGVPPLLFMALLKKDRSGDLGAFVASSRGENFRIDFSNDWRMWACNFFILTTIVCILAPKACKCAVPNRDSIYMYNYWLKYFCADLCNLSASIVAVYIVADYVADLLMHIFLLLLRISMQNMQDFRFVGW